MKATTKNLWAPIIKPKRGAEWICWPYVAPTKRESRAYFLRDIPPSRREEALTGVRLTRVTITEQ